MTLNTELAAIIEKIKKLNAKANGGATEEEAALFAMKVQELLAKHNLDMSVIKTVDEAETLIDEEIYETPYTLVPWYNYLINAVSKLYFCKVLAKKSHAVNSKGKPYIAIKFVVFGREGNRAVVFSMMDYLTSTVKRLSLNYSKVLKQRYHFERGAGMRLVTRVSAMIQDVTTPKSSNPGNLPALYQSEAEKVAEAVKASLGKNFEKLVENPLVRHTKTTMDYAAGREAANGISLNTQIGNGKGLKLLK